MYMYTLNSSHPQYQNFHFFWLLQAIENAFVPVIKMVFCNVEVSYMSLYLYKMQKISDVSHKCNCWLFKVLLKTFDIALNLSDGLAVCTTCSSRGAG